jgi:hypothetical protein
MTKGEWERQWAASAAAADQLKAQSMAVFLDLKTLPHCHVTSVCGSGFKSKNTATHLTSDSTWQCGHATMTAAMCHRHTRLTGGTSSAPHSFIWSQQPVHKCATSNQHVHNHHTTNTLATLQQRLCFDLWRLCNIFITLIAVWDAPLGFFLLFCETRKQRVSAVKTHDLATIIGHIHDR